MSFSRHRHVFTLGSPRRSKRWQPADLFESDPFKINSYNFRYAERPSLPLPVAAQRRINNEISKDCQTYFYNNDFSNINNLNAANSGRNKRKLCISKHQNYRRRRFLNEPRFYKSWHETRTAENFLNFDHTSCTNNVLNSCHGQGSARTLISNSNSIPATIKSQACARNDLNPSSSHHLQKGHDKANPSSSSNYPNNRHISGSGCEINININGLENKSLHDNVNINIATDSATRNLNIPLNNSMRHSNLATSQIEQLKPSNSFVINKRLSRFCSSQDKQNDFKITERERAKELTSIYSSRMLNKTPTADCGKLRERLPFRTNSLRGNKSTVTIGNPVSQKSFIQSVRESLSVYDNKASKKSSSRNNLHRNSYKLDYRESKSLNSFSKMALKGSASQRTESKSMLRNTGRLPLNININLFADNLKG